MKKALDSTATPAEAVESPGLIKIVAFFCPSVVFIAFLCCPLIVWLLLRSMAYVKSIMFFSSWYFDTRTAEGRELEAQQDRLRVWLARIFAVATTLIGITIMVGLTASGWTEDVAGRGLHNDIVGTGLVGSLTPEEFKHLNSVAFWWLLAACVFVVALAVPINRRIRAIRQRSLQVNLYRYDDSSEPDNFDDY